MNQRSGALYVINDDVSRYVRSDMNKKRIWDLVSEFKVRNQISLEEQHGNHNLLSGPLHLEVTFYLSHKAIKKPERDRHNQFCHTTRPYLSCLIYFLETICANTVFVSGCHIVSVISQKYYDSDNPRTEFRFYEVDKYGKEKE